MAHARNHARARPRWRYVAATAALILGFAGLWALAWLLFGLGTCGEDSDISAADYARLCDPGDRIARNLTVIGIAAVASAVGLGAAAIRRRATRPVLLLAAVLTLAGAASLAADRL